MAGLASFKCRYILASAACLSLLAGCGEQAPITQPNVTVSFANAATASAVTALDTITVRTRLRTDDGTGEIAGTPCRLNGPNYTARFAAPAVVEVPIFGNSAPSLVVSCEFENETRSERLRAENVSARERQDAREQALDDLRDDDVGAAVLISLQLGATGPRGFDEFDYPNLSFTFRR